MGRGTAGSKKASEQEAAKDALSKRAGIKQEEKVKITKVVVGLLEENCYVLEKDKQVIVVDPGDEYERIKKVIGHKKQQES